MMQQKRQMWICKLLKQAKINLAYQGSPKQLDKALALALKEQASKHPQYCGVIKDFVIVIEHRPDISKHVKYDYKGLICQEQIHIENYALNNALWYARQIIKNQNTYTKAFAIAISGDGKRHRITPMFIDDVIQKPLKHIKSLIFFNEKNIEQYYRRELLKEFDEGTQIQKIASILHEDLRNYGALDDRSKCLVVAGILLALDEMRARNLHLSYLNNDKIYTDGSKIYDLIGSNLKRCYFAREIDGILSQFSVIRDTKKINEPCYISNKKGLKIHSTPLKYYVQFIKENIFDPNMGNFHDYLGIFYSEFMRFNGGDGQNLGIVLTPAHIAKLFCELVQLRASDRVLDPCCGTGGFLIAAMDYMLLRAKNEAQRQEIKKDQLFGFELQSLIFCLASANMILRADGRSNLYNEDFLRQDPLSLQKQFMANIGFMNPPYSQGKTDKNLSEIAFSYHLLNSLLKRARAVVIVPQSAMIGKSKEERAIKASILEHHSLEGVITLNKNTFYGVRTNPCIAVFIAGIPHAKDRLCKFINFEDDGYEVQKHRGLVQGIHARQRREYLLRVWHDEVRAPSKFCVKTRIKANDEWLHSFYYFNDEIPSHEEFEETMANYLSFEFNMITHGRAYLFNLQDKEDAK